MSESSVHLRQLISAIMRDIAQARVEADYFSKQASDRYRNELPGFTVPRIDISDVGMDIKLLVDRIAEAEKGNSDEVTLAIQKAIQTFVIETLLPLWQAYRKISVTDRKQIEDNLVKLLYENILLKVAADDNDKVELTLNITSSVTVINDFFTKQQTKAFIPSKNQFTSLSNSTILLDNADNIFVAEYGSSTSSPIIIKSTIPELGNIVIDNIREKMPNSNKPAPVYVCRGALGEGEQLSALFMYGKYHLEGAPAEEGPAISIFGDSINTKILTSLTGISSGKSFNLAISPPDFNNESGLLALYDNKAKKLRIIDYKKDEEKYNKTISQHIFWMGFTKAAKQLVIVTSDPTHSYRRKIRILNLTGIENMTSNIFQSQHLLSGFRWPYYCAFSESGQEKFFHISDQNTITTINYGQRSGRWEDRPTGWETNVTNMPLNNHYVHRLSSSQDSKLIAVLCCPNTRGWTNSGGVFYVYIYSADLQNILARYEISPYPLERRPASFKMFFMASNDLVIIRNQEMYTLPATYIVPSKDEIEIALESMESHKFDSTKINEIKVKVNQDELLENQDSIGSLKINFKVKNYKWEKTMEENSEAGQLIEEMNN